MSSEPIQLKYNIELKPGEVTPHFELTEEDKQTLINLHESRSWKLYSKMLGVFGNATLNSLLAEIDPVKIQKSLGLVAGVNFAQNQLGIQVAHFKKQREIVEAKRVAAESKKQPRPLR